MDGLDQFTFRYFPDKDVEDLLIIAANKHTVETVRVNALLDLSRTVFDIAIAEKDEQAATDLASRLLPLFTDPDENPRIRGHIADQFSHHWDDRAIQPLFDGLRDQAVEVRFWSAFGLVMLRQHILVDLTPIRTDLDALVAAEDVLPGLWSAGREALPLLEALDFEPLRRENNGLPTQYETALLSTQPEYNRYLDETTRSGGYIAPDFADSYRMTPERLSARLRRLRRRALLQIDVRPPLQSYTLTWKIGADETLLMGALHCDGCAVVLTGSRRMIARFAARYRTMLPRDVSLYLYAWFGDGHLIRPRTRPREIINAHW